VRKSRFPCLFGGDAIKLKSEQVFGKKTREKVPSVVASRRKIGYTSAVRFSEVD
jgi:hypothetical protein